MPSYRGAIELSQASGTEANKLHVVNIVEIEDYVPGVVANESIASFHMEALKAQAVAARVPGLNVIQYNPVGKGEATVMVAVD